MSGTTKDILSSLRNGGWVKEGKQDEAQKILSKRIESWMKTNPNLTPEEDQSLREKPEENSVVRPDVV